MLQTAKIFLLSEVIENLNTLDDSLTIYAESNEDWTMFSHVILVAQPQDGGVPQEAIDLGMVYFLETSIAKEVLEDWMIGKKVNHLSLPKKCEILSYYAKYDSYLQY